MAQVVGVVGNKCFAAKRVAQVSAAASYPFLKIVRVGAYLEHLRVVVGLNHKIVGALYHRGNLFGDVSHVCQQAEHHTVVLDGVAGIVGAVVWNSEGRDTKVADREAYPRLYVHPSVVRNLAAHTHIAVQTRVDGARGINRYVKLLGYAAYRFDVVGMVVCHEYSLDAVEIVEAIVAKMVLQFAGSNPHVYKDAPVFCI